MVSNILNFDTSLLVTSIRESDSDLTLEMGELEGASGHRGRFTMLLIFMAKALFLIIQGA